VTILVTGVAGFIGYHVAEALLARGDSVIGLDNLNPYYDVRLKEARLDRLSARPGFLFHRADVADRAAVAEAAGGRDDITEIVHLAAQAGVRHSLVDPYSYVHSNVMGHLTMLELARGLPGLRHFVYASSSSVYGANRELPFRETDPVNTPVSLYAATKRADELMSYSYAHLFGLRQTGLRFFTVYGPWGRPDMAVFAFARAIVEGTEIALYDGGRLKRDFTYIDDIVAGVVGCLDHPPGGNWPGGDCPGGAATPGDPPARVLNIGNNRAEEVSSLLALLEQALGRKAVVRSVPRPATDVAETYADVSAIAALTGFQPSTPLSEGIPRFVAWFRGWNAAG